MVFHVKTYNQFFFKIKIIYQLFLYNYMKKNKRIINFKNNKNIDNKK